MFKKETHNRERGMWRMFLLQPETHKSSQNNLRGVCFILSLYREGEQRAHSHERKHHPDDHQVGHCGVPSEHSLWGP